VSVSVGRRRLKSLSGTQRDSATGAQDQPSIVFAVRRRWGSVPLQGRRERYGAFLARFLSQGPSLAMRTGAPGQHGPADDQGKGRARARPGRLARRRWNATPRGATIIRMLSPSTAIGTPQSKLSRGVGDQHRLVSSISSHTPHSGTVGRHRADAAEPCAAGSTQWTRFLRRSRAVDPAAARALSDYTVDGLPRGGSAWTGQLALARGDPGRVGAD